MAEWEFSVLLELSPSVKIPNYDQLLYDFPNNNRIKSMRIIPIMRSVKEEILQAGLTFKIILTAKNMDEAVKYAHMLADLTCTGYSIMSGVGLSVPKVLIAYDSTEGKNEREFSQYFYGPQIFGLTFQPSTINLDMESSTLFLNQFFSTSNNKEKERIARSLRWYRLGLLESDHYDSYICFWTGLENLDSSLKKQLSIRSRSRKCPHCSGTEGVICIQCGEKISPPPPTIGIEGFMEKMGLDEETYRELSRVRNDIIHGNALLSKLEVDVNKNLPILSEILFRAILYLCSDQNWEEHKYPTMMRNIEIWMKISTKLIGLNPLDIQNLEMEPHFALINDVEKVKTEKGIKISGKTRLKSYLLPGIKTGEMVVEMHGTDPTFSAIMKSLEDDEKLNEE
jgi:hypothetical protein